MCNRHLMKSKKNKSSVLSLAFRLLFLGTSIYISPLLFLFTDASDISGC